MQKSEGVKGLFLLPTIRLLAECCKGPLKYQDIKYCEAVNWIDSLGVLRPGLTETVDAVPTSEAEK